MSGTPVCDVTCSTMAATWPGSTTAQAMQCNTGKSSLRASNPLPSRANTRVAKPPETQPLALPRPMPLDPPVTRPEPVIADPAGKRGSGIVDQCVGDAGLRRDLLHQGRDLAGIADIAGDAMQSGRVLLERFERARIARAHRGREALGQEAPGNRQADAFRSAGDQDRAGHSGPGISLPVSSEMPLRPAVRSSDSVIIATSCAQNSFSRGLYNRSALALVLSQIETNFFPAAEIGRAHV